MSTDTLRQSINTSGQFEGQAKWSTDSTRAQCQIPELSGCAENLVPKGHQCEVWCILTWYHPANEFWGIIWHNIQFAGK